jgi:cytochrome b pre-mRNA-processing protein 3
LILRLFRKDTNNEAVGGLYARAAAAARAPALYLSLGVPDTLEGRFEALSLHVVLILRALRRLPPPAGDVATDLTDRLFSELDGSLREMGVSDTSVPKRMKNLAGAFYGRAEAYDSALAAGDRAALAGSLARNVLGREAPALPLARYVEEADLALMAQSLDDLFRNGPDFPRPDRFPPEDTP